MGERRKEPMSLLDQCLRKIERERGKTTKKEREKEREGGWAGRK